MVQTEMTVAVTRARSWCALGVAVTAAAKAGSDGANGGWKDQGTAAAEAVTGRGKNVKWQFGHPPPPPPGLYKRFWQPKSLPGKIFAILSEFGLLAFLKSQKF